MSSENVGVQALIMHCNGHCLNLVIAHSCTLPVVCNMIDKMKSTTISLTYSPKREQLLIEDAHSMDRRNH